MNGRTVLRGGTVVGPDPAGGVLTGLRRADLAIVGDRIVAVGIVPVEAGDVVVDCSERLLLPGLVDVHSHADAQVFDDSIAHALLRQGVTAVIAGQDGVSYAPGDGAFATRYFAAINGTHPTYAGSRVADLLATYDRTTAVNVGYLVPAGTVREQVLGMSAEPADFDQLEAMCTLVAEGLEDGALGLSTGLDYVPGLFAGSEEIAELCRPVAAAGRVYVTHMRGGYEENSAAGLDEVMAICRAAGVKGHVSHFHARSELLTALVDAANETVDLTFDSYPYSRGSSLLGMLLLPPAMLRQGLDVCAAQLLDPELRRKTAESWVAALAARADMGPQWADHVRFAHVAAPEFDWVHGLTLAEASVRAGSTPGELGLQVLAESGLEVGVVMTTPVERSDDQMAAHLRHPKHMGGSDGIYRGRCPHPRGWGAFGRYLDVFVGRGDLTWADCVDRFSRAPADRFGLAGRGRLIPGALADVVIVDPDSVHVGSSYAEPRRLADGIDDVWVNGGAVLRGGELTGVRSGRGLRWGQ